MKKLIISLIIGIIAGIIDIVPMIFQKVDRYSITSAFIQWIIIAFVTTYIQFGVGGWLKGLIVAILMASPIVILVMKTEPMSVMPILIMSTLLGSVVGFIGDKYVR